MLIPIIQAFIVERSGADWIEALEKVGVPCGPLNDMEQVFVHPQIKHRGLQMEMPHPLAGSVPQVASPIKFEGEEFDYQNAPPTLGQHTDDVLRGILEMDEAEIASLRASGIVEG